MKITKMHKNLIDELEDIMAQEIQQEIDDSLMIDMMVAIGWTKIELAPFINRYQAVDIKN